VTPHQVRLADGRTLTAPLVIDARGPRRGPHLVLAWQKFVGRLVRLDAPHGLTRPTVMDAGVPQLDGYRFLYVLPFGPDRMLIEDTRYSDGPGLDRAGIGREIDAYAARHGWRVAEVEKEEEGVLRSRSPATSTPIGPPHPRRARGGPAQRPFPPPPAIPCPTPRAWPTPSPPCPTSPAPPSARAHRNHLQDRVGLARLLQAPQPHDVPRLRARPALPHPPSTSTASRKALWSGSTPPTPPWPTRSASSPASRRCDPAGDGLPERTLRLPGRSGRLTRVAVIGAGFGGLALAVRLQSAGFRRHPDRGARQARRPRLRL